MGTAGGSTAGGVDHLLRHQYSLQHEASKVAGLVSELKANNQERDEEIAKLSFMLDGIKARTSLRSSMHLVGAPPLDAWERGAAVAVY